MLQVKNIHKQYKTGDLIQTALDNVSLNLRDNEFVAILGPSGSGKTTLLNIIGGLDRYDKGDLIINGISTKKYKDRDWDSYRNHTIGFVFQSYNLIPHQTILANVELALTISGLSKSKRREKAIKALEQVGLANQIHKKPNQLSGGQMQRVAIARALVNDPDIVLADEPTGALDSDTSIQVMELLKKVAKDRLVVMVTHNPELAEDYATRIVNIKDGKILSDTNPYIIEKEKNQKPIHKNLGKTTMSFLTSLSLSFNNLKTKKGRTILTSFAGSIGIIGIALILSLSNGANIYIKSVEEDTLSEYPLQIQSTGIDMSSLLIGTNNEEEKENEGDINVSKRITNMFSTIGSNDLKSFKKYLESDESNIKKYTKSIEYSYDVTPTIYTSDTENIRQVNPDTTFASLGMGAGASSNSMMSSMMSTNVFFKMPKDSKLYENQYDVKAGKWPTSYNECVLVLTSQGNISDFLLYTLGLRDYSEIQDLVTQFSSGKEVDTPKDLGTYNYEDILGTTFKLVNVSACYEYDEEYKVWRDKTDNKEYMKNVVRNGEDLKIVGIVQPKEGATSTMLSSGIYYPDSLTNHVIENAKSSKIVQDQLSKPEVNVFTSKRFDETEKENSFDMNSLIDIDTNAIKSAFKVDKSKINLDFGDLNNLLTQNSLPAININDILSKIQFSMSQEDIKNIILDLVKGYEEYIQNKPDANINEISKQLTEYLQTKEVNELINRKIKEFIKENGSLTITQKQLEELMKEILSGYENYVNDNGLVSVEDLNKYIVEYMNSNKAKDVITKNISKIMTSQNLEKQITNIMGQYMQNVMGTISKNLQTQMESSIKKLSKTMTNAISIDENAFMGAFKMKMNEEELAELFNSIMNKESVTYESNLRKLNYANFDEPSEIDIYPKDFEGNKAITSLIKDYNTSMKENGEEDKVISYADMIGSLMSSVTTIVDTISYVLIAFVAISLVVSSIMIGVITYISVLERKKEIGILRAMGASKQNVSQVFNAETIIIGGLAGIIGVGITLLLIIPINQIIAVIANGVNVKASLPLGAGIILIVLSIVLTLTGGIIPSKKAAKEDPVLALRSE
ncbi:MAG: ATP-binding cassette domain-containing protein [Clostridia bacterium]|nr:ATP-binding cassette domain-containing protein [Clostridium sp.]